MSEIKEPTFTGLPAEEIERRYRLIRQAAAADGLDAVLVCGNEYTGFEGAVAYLSGFVIVHRYAYVLLPVDGDPSIIFPSELATSVSTTQPGSPTSSSSTAPANGSPSGCVASASVYTGSTT